MLVITMNREQKLKKVMENPVLWIQNFVQIPNKEGKLIPFKLNELQKNFIDNWDKYNIILKSRQLGFSTLSCGLSLYYACTQSNVDILMVSYSIDSATAIFDRLKIMYSTIPSAIKPTLNNNNKKELKFDNGSRIVCATAGNKELARGMTLKFCHLSEYAFWKDNAPKQLLAIEQSLSGKLVIESTANGLNHFNELYVKAENKENLYKDFFYNWYENKSMFAKDYKFAVETWKGRNNGKLLSEDELTEEERGLLDKGATIEQLIWRRLKISNSSDEQFKQEFPATPLEAFLTTGNGIFDNEFIAERSRYLPKVISKPSDLPNELKIYWGNSLKIWLPKKLGEKYYIGVDASEGLKQDYSVVEILDSQCRQVAEFRSNTVKPYKLAEVVNAIGKYFNNGFLVVEKASAGHTVLDRLRHDYKYLNMYKHKEYDYRGKAKKKIGFLTSEKSKSMIINDLVEVIETNNILINSKNVLEEMKVFVVNGSKMGAMQGRHDDTIMSLAMALHGLKQGKWYV
jgi:hypothetical protein